MDADFPAAHSMDTTWFAVDADGHVGYFKSWEAGAVPRLVRHGVLPIEAFDLLDRLAEVVPTGAPTRNEYGFLNPASVGLFVYEHADRFENWNSGPYVRKEVPSQPLHVDQLPPQVREHVSRMHFDCLTFREEMAIQPVELAACDSWQSEYMTMAGEKKPMPND